MKIKFWIVSFTCFIFIVFLNVQYKKIEFSNPLNQTIRYKNNGKEITENTRKRSLSISHWNESSINKKTCIYLHGSGVYSEKTVVTDDFKDYWGNIKDFTLSYCDDHYFVITNTYDFGWDDSMLQELYCNATTFGYNQKKMILTHSMGGLILGASFFNRSCKRNKNNIFWMASQTPLKGSIASNNLFEICELKSDETYSHWFYRMIGENFGYCNVSNHQPAISYQSMKTYIQKVGDYAFNSINKMMCGTNPFGLFSRYSLALEFLNWVSGFQYINDGMVSINSCMNDQQKLCQSSQDKNYYCAEMNHADGTCRNGNSDRYKIYPCSFFKETK